MRVEVGEGHEGWCAGGMVGSFSERAHGRQAFGAALPSG